MEEQSTDAACQAPTFTDLNDLATEKLGTKIIFSTDDWFAVAENMFQVHPATFDPEAFTDFGKMMDGWETRRKRIPGHDWCIIQLGAPGVVKGLDVDTSFFTGNYSPRCSVQAANIATDLPARKGDRIGTRSSEDEEKEIAKLESEKWTDLLPMTSLRPGYKSTCHNYFPVDNGERWTHLRLNMFPDGGIARLRVYGLVAPDWSKITTGEPMDLASVLNGGVCVGYSNVHYGHARNVIGPGRSAIMADGWETARRMDRPAILVADEKGVLQVPGHEWAAFKLGHPGVISKIEIDTNHFKGNFPDSCRIEACLSSATDTCLPEGPWRTLLPVTKLSAHKQHYFEGRDLEEPGLVSHVRVTIAPDGGISRMRLWGIPKKPE